MRVSPSRYGELLTLAGGLNHSVNGQSLTTRCKFYSLAGIPTSGMSCPTPGGLPNPEPPISNRVCPDGYDMEFSTVNGMLLIKCVRPATTGTLLPVPGRYIVWLFGHPISLAHLGPKATGTPNGIWAFGGFGLTIGWLNEGS